MSHGNGHCGCGRFSEPDVWGSFRSQTHDCGYNYDEGYYVYYEIPWSQVDPFNDGFRRFNLTVETVKANNGGTAFAALAVVYTDDTDTLVEGTSGDAGSVKSCSLTCENNKTPKALRFGCKIWINNYWGGRRAFN